MKPTRPARLALGLGPALLLLASCTGEATTEAGRDAAEVTATCADCVDVVTSERLRSFQTGPTTKNLELVDWTNPVRNQGAVGSCQSFAFLGTVENRLFQDYRVSLDLSERYQLFSNYMHFGGLGSAPTQVVRRHEVVAHWGVMPESAYPYSDVNRNAAVFEVDSAQGLTSGTRPALDVAIEGKSATERHSVLQDDRFLGRLPAGEHPIALPVTAALDDASIVRQVSLANGGAPVPCFSKGAATQRLAVSPLEFAKHCLRTDSYRYAASGPGLMNDEPSEFCSSAATMSALATKIAASRRDALREALKSLVMRRAVLLAFAVPNSREDASGVVWRSSGVEATGGHAVLGVGFLTAKDLASLESQKAGLLGTGLFDRFALSFDSAQTIPSPDASPEALRDARMSSKLGKILEAEQGALLIRNSWGDVAGVQGLQLVTFDYFLDHGVAVLHEESSALSEIGTPLAVVAKPQAAAAALRLLAPSCPRP